MTYSSYVRVVWGGFRVVWGVLGWFGVFQRTPGSVRLICGLTGVINFMALSCQNIMIPMVRACDFLSFNQFEDIEEA